MVSSRISVTVSIGSGANARILSAPAEFTVARRPWAPFHYHSPIGPQYVSDRRAWGFTPLPILGVAFQLSAFITDKIDFPDEQTDSVAVGPNAGWQFYAAPPFINIPVVALYQGLAPGDAGKWAQGQNGKDPYGTTGPVYGLPYCTQQDLPRLNAEAQRHEGIGMARNSHYWQSDSALAASGLDTTLEALASRGPRVELDTVAQHLFDAFSSADSIVAVEFDRTDYPNIFKTILHCEPDDDPYDNK